MKTKANILKIGSITQDGPTGWVFQGADVALEMSLSDPPLYCGYTLDELKAIADGSAFDKAEIVQSARTNYSSGWMSSEIHPVPMNRKIIYCDCDGRMYLDYGEKAPRSIIIYWRELPEMP